MRAERWTLLLWLLFTSPTPQAAPADPADDLAFLEFLALMIEDDEGWIDPLTAREALPRALDTEAPQAPVPDSEVPTPESTAPVLPEDDGRRAP